MQNFYILYCIIFYDIAFSQCRSDVVDSNIHIRIDYSPILSSAIGGYFVPPLVYIVLVLFQREASFFFFRLHAGMIMSWPILFFISFLFCT